MKNYRKGVLYLILLFLSYTAMADEGLLLHGVIYDKSGLPLPRAVVTAEGEVKKVAIADQNGVYQLYLPSGRYDLKIQFVNFVTIKKKIELKRSMKLDFVLQEDSEMLDEVTVYADASQQIIQKKTFSAISLDVSPITASLIDLSTLINKSSGVKLRESGGVGSDFNLTINGLGGNAIQYFIDGVPLSSMGSGISIANLPVNLVDKVEIYKGVVPPELGMDALGGAINIITKRSLDNYLDVSLGAGSFGTFNSNASGQYMVGRSGLTIRPAISYSYAKNDYIMKDVEVWDKDAEEYVLKDLPRFHDGYRSFLGQLEVGYKDTYWADDAFIGGSYSDVYKEIQTGVQQTVVIGEANRSKKALRLLARYNKRDLFLDGLSTSLHVSYTQDHSILTDTCYRSYSWDGSYVKRAYSEVTGRGKSIRHTVRPQLVGRANISYAPSAENAITFTYSLSSIDNRRYDDYDTEFIETNDRLTKHIMGLAYSHSFYDERLLANLFLKEYLYKAEINQKDFAWITGANDIVPKTTHNYLGYGLGSRYSFSPAFAIKLSYEKAVRLPMTRELLGNGETIYANLKLKPEIANNLNLSTFGNSSIYDGHTIRYETNLFMRKVTNYIHRVVIDERQSQYNNVGAATVWGGEAELSYEYNRLFNLTINATYLEERNKTRLDKWGHPSVTYNNRMPNRPYLYGNVIAGANIRNPMGLKDHRIKLDLSYSYIHSFFLTWEAFGTKESKATIPSQSIVNGGITWFFPKDKYSISLQGSNLLDNRLYDNFMLQKPGRAFYCKLQLFI